jgi:hypothetical protein
VLLYRFRRELTAETLRAQSKEFLIKNPLCELCASVVDILHRNPGITSYSNVVF